MKRSEAVGIIADILIRNEMEPYVSSAILEALEELGMLPPIWDGMSQERWISPNKEMFEVFTWEEE